MPRPAPLIAALVTLAACTPTPPEVARQQFDSMCADCHGPAGRGNGTLAPLLDTAPADLTTLSARNDGTFPLVDVLSRIDGYSHRDAMHSTATMPEFGSLLQGEKVLIDTGDGTLTPVPEQLVALAEYVETLQQ